MDSFRDNLQGAVLMVLAMFGFAVEDMLIKYLSASLPVGQLLVCMGAGGALVFGAICKRQGNRFLDKRLLTRPIIFRNLSEIIGTMGFVTAIAFTPISTASAILQATPLVVTLGAALFFKETVGWRRWSAISIGFFGVLLIIRPGTEGFDSLSIITLIGVLGLSLRDLATRSVPKETSSMQLSFLAFLSSVPTGILLSIIFNTGWAPLTARILTILAICILVAVLAYYGIVAAMRVGEISFVTPFRYTRLVFALCFGVLIFHERPDALTLLGSAIIVASGIYTLWREHRVKQKIPLHRQNA